MNIYEKRWEAAKQLILDIKKMCKENDISHVEYDGERYHIDNLIVHENVEIAHTNNFGTKFYSRGGIYLLNDDKYVSTIIFENTLDYDHGLYDKISEFRKELLSSMKFYKEVKFDFMS